MRAHVRDGPVTLFRGTFLDTPVSPFAGGTLRSEADGGLCVRDGVIVDRGAFAAVRAHRPDDEVVDLSGGLVLPGFVDTHVHFPQVRMIGALGMPLLDWLERSALPEEARLVDDDYARAVAESSSPGCRAAGTTTALVFGAHFASAVDILFAEAARARTADHQRARGERPDPAPGPAHHAASAAYDEGRALAERWHGVGRTRYAVIPRFSLSCSEALLDSCAALLGEIEGAWFTSHVNENLAEVATVGRALRGLPTTTWHLRPARPGRRPQRLRAQRARDAPASSTSSPPRGPASRTARPATPPWAAGCSRSASTSSTACGSPSAPMSVPAPGSRCSRRVCRPTSCSSCSVRRGCRSRSAHLLHLATAAGAEVLGLADQVGDFEVGKQFDALWLRPAAGSTLDVGLRHADGPDQSLAKAFALGTPADVASVWVGGPRALHSPGTRRPAKLPPCGNQ